jgi:hypothetical protein
MQTKSLHEKKTPSPYFETIVERSLIHHFGFPSRERKDLTTFYVNRL